MNLTLKIWRQKDAKSKGKMVSYEVTEISDDMSFLEMMDVLNEQLINKNANDKKTVNVGDLSMGMSEDYLEAVDCGATYIRIGSKIFGDRS